MIESLLNLIVSGFLLLCALIIARTITRLLHLFFEDELQQFLIELGIGFGILSYGVLLLGQLKIFSPSIVLGILGLVLILFLKSFLSILQSITVVYAKGMQSKLSRFEWVMCAGIFVVALTTLVGSLAPAIGHDALSYHLYLPKQFIATHSIGFLHYTRESLWPFFTEMLFTLGMLVRNEIVAKLFHWYFFIGLIVLVFKCASLMMSRKKSLFAAIIFALTPGVFMQATYAYIDLALAFYITGVAYLLFLFVRTSKTQWIVFAGIFTGFAVSIKILAVPYLGSLLVLFFLFFFQKKQIKNYFLYFLIALCGCAIWYIRSWILAGNPFYPFFSSFFSGHGWANKITENVGMGKSVGQFILLPWNLTMHPQPFGSQQLGVFYLLFLPFVLSFKMLHKMSRLIVVFSLTFICFWFVSVQNLRFFLVVVPFLSMIYARCGVVRDQEEEGKISSWFYSFIVCVGVLVLLFNLCLCFYHNYDKIKVVVGIESVKSYLARKERTYNVFDFINSTLPQSAKILSIDEPRLFYSNKPIVLFDLFMKREKDRKNQVSFDVLKEYGFTHILYKENGVLPKGCSFTLDDLKQKPLLSSFSFSLKNKKSAYYLYAL